MYTSSLDIANSEFSDNHTGIYIFDASPRIVYSNILNNSGYGVNCQGYSSPTIDTNIFQNNGYGLYVTSNSTPYVTNNTFIDNSTYDAYFVNGISTSLINNKGGGSKHSGIYITGSIGNSVKFTHNPGMPYVFHKVTIPEGVTLEIEPGAIVKFYYSQAVLNVYGTLLADGLESQPIVFTSFHDDIHGGDTDKTVTIPGAGDWVGINIYSTGSLSTLRYAIIQYAGNIYSGCTDCKQAGIFVEESSPTIDNCTISHNGTYGIKLNNASPTVSNNTISDHQYGIQTYGTLGGTFTNNTVTDGTYAGLYFTGEITSNITLNHNPGMPYIFHEVLVPAGVTLTLEPGTVIKFLGTSSHLYVHGTLIADGLENEPIVFTSLKDDSYGGDTDNYNNTPSLADWQGINIQPTSGGSILRHSVIKYAGTTAGIYISGASPIIDNCLISQNSSTGIYLYNASPAITNSTISNNQYGLRVTGTSAPTLDSNIFEDCTSYSAMFSGGILGGSFTNNTATGGYYAGFYIIGTIQTDITLNNNPGMPYIFTQVTVPEGVTLTVEPGTVVKFSATTSYLDINGTLLADGLAEAPIVFTSDADDSYGGDTNNNGAEEPEKGSWGGVRLLATGGDSIFRHCVIKHASTGLAVTGKNPVIDHCTIDHNTQYGIQLANASPNVSDCVISDSGYGIYASGTSGPNIVNCAFISNISHGLYSSNSSQTIMAENNFWGHSTGPLDISDDTSSGGLYNPDGLGNRTSDYVDYAPWLGIAEDSDNDNIPDYWELLHFGNLTTADDTTDSDSDGLTDLEEYQLGTNPKLSDTDNDGMPDGWEAHNGLDPLANDANGDKDGDGYTNLQEYLSSTDPDNNLAVPIPPVADAGPDQLVGENIVVTLSAANSFDLDDGIGSYLWQQVYGDTVNLSDASAIQPHFTSSAGLDPSGISLKFRLTVTDNGGLQTTDTCIVNVSWSNEPPVSSTGQDQDALQDETVSLNGSNSTDLEGEISYLWQQISGSPVSLDDSAIISPTLTTPSDLTAGESLIFELTVSDLDGLQATDSSIVNVTWDNEVPQSVAGPDQMVEPAAMVTLDGSSSHDPDGSIDLYRWKQTQGTPAILSDPISTTPTFTVPDTCTDGNTMVFELWITDDYGLISRDQCLITIDALPADLNEDGDSDGSDLVDFIHQLSSGDAAMTLENFAATFGR